MKRTRYYLFGTALGFVLTATGCGDQSAQHASDGDPADPAASVTLFVATLGPGPSDDTKVRVNVAEGESFTVDTVVGEVAFEVTSVGDDAIELTSDQELSMAPVPCGSTPEDTSTTFTIEPPEPLAVVAGAGTDSTYLTISVSTRDDVSAPAAAPAAAAGAGTARACTSSDLA